MAGAGDVTAALATLGPSGWGVIANTVFNTPGLVGTSTNNAAAAGMVGEMVWSTVDSGSPVSLASNTAANVTSISLTPGDWDIAAQVMHALAGLTSVTQLNASTSLTSATLSPQQGGGGLGAGATATQTYAATTPSGAISQEVANVRLSIAATTIVYLVAKAIFSVSTAAAYGTIRARRAR